MVPRTGEHALPKMPILLDMSSVARAGAAGGREEQLVEVSVIEEIEIVDPEDDDVHLTSAGTISIEIAIEEDSQAVTVPVMRAAVPTRVLPKVVAPPKRSTLARGKRVPDPPPSDGKSPWCRTTSPEASAVPPEPEEIEESAWQHVVDRAGRVAARLAIPGVRRAVVLPLPAVAMLGAILLGLGVDSLRGGAMREAAATLHAFVDPAHDPVLRSEASPQAFSMSSEHPQATAPALEALAVPSAPPPPVVVTAGTPHLRAPAAAAPVAPAVAPSPASPARVAEAKPAAKPAAPRAASAKTERSERAERAERAEDEKAERARDDDTFKAAAKAAHDADLLASKQLERSLR